MDLKNEKVKNLEFIQNIISRMASNSLELKKLTVTIITGITVFLTIQTTKNYLILTLLLPTIIFGLLDAYYLNLERKYRELYKQALNDLNYEPFDLNACTEEINKQYPYCSAVFSTSIMPFYLTIIISILIYYLCLK